MQIINISTQFALPTNNYNGEALSVHKIEYDKKGIKPSIYCRSGKNNSYTGFVFANIKALHHHCHTLIPCNYSGCDEKNWNHIYSQKLVPFDILKNTFRKYNSEIYLCEKAISAYIQRGWKYSIDAPIVSDNPLEDGMVARRLTLNRYDKK